MDVQAEIDRSFRYGQELEEFVASKEIRLSDDRDVLLVGYWALLFDYHAAILELLRRELYGSAFALLRPVVEAWVRAHLVVSCTNEDVIRIKNDEYRMNFKEVGAKIDKAFGLNFFENTLKEPVRKALHSYTHSGRLQVNRRFDGHLVKPNYTDDAILDVLEGSTTAVFMATILVTNRLGFAEEWRTTNQLFDQYHKGR
jgi:hypothetical protein